MHQLQISTGRSLYIPNSIRELIGGDLVTPTLQISNQGELVLTERSMLDQSPLPNSDEEPDDLEEYYTSYGLAEVIQCLAKMQGVEMQLPWLSSMELSSPNLSGLTNPCVAQFISRFHTGLLEIGQDVTTAQIIIDVCRAFRGSRILVLGPHREPLARICKSINQSNSGIRVFNLLDPPKQPKSRNRGRFHPVTFQLVMSTYLESIECDKVVHLPYTRFPIVLCLQPECIRGSKNMDFLLGPNPRFRVYGILPINPKLAATDRDQLVNVFGIRHLRVPASGFERTAVNWIAIRNKKSPRGFGRNSTISVNTQALQLCRHRNKLLCDFALRLTRPDWKSCEGRAGDWLAAENQGADSPRVVVVADGDKQIRSLKELLKEWPVFEGVSGPMSVADWLTPDTRDDRPRAFICSEDALERLALVFDPAVIINAVGRRDALSLPQNWLRHPATGGTRSRRLIIDVDDRATPLTKKWSQVRFAAYNNNEIFNEIFRFAPQRDNEIQFHVFQFQRFVERTFRPIQNPER